MSKRTTVYLDEKTLGKFNIYKTSLGEDDKVSFSELVNKLLESHLNNPFNWNNTTLYDYAMQKYISNGECDNE